MTHALLHRPVTTEHRRGLPAVVLTRRELDVLRLLAKGNTTGRSPANSASRSAPSKTTGEPDGQARLVSRVELVNYAEENNLL